MKECLSYEEQECLDSFIDELNDKLTSYCQLPFSLSKKALASIIKQAKKYFYAHYDDAVEEIYIAISKDAFKSEEFVRGYNDKNPEKLTKEDTNTRRAVVEMPSNIYSVNGVFEIGGFGGESGGWTTSSIWNTRDKDFAIGKFVYSSAFDTGPGAGGAADNLMCYVVNEYWLDTARQVLKHQIGYTYNRLTHLFRFTGELPRRTCVFQVYKTIDDCALFQDELFFRYCTAAAMAELGRILGTFTYNYPGNVTINVDSYQSEGKDELESIKEEMKEMTSADYFLTS